MRYIQNKVHFNFVRTVGKYNTVVAHICITSKLRLQLKNINKDFISTVKNLKNFSGFDIKL